MDGYEVCTRLKSSPATRHLPILLITALEDEESNSKGIEAGADDFVHKPFDINDMLSRIEGFLT
jgi:two-component system cell cycle response regulator